MIKRRKKIYKRSQFIKKIRKKEESRFIILDGYYLKNDKILKHINIKRRKYVKNYANRLSRRRTKMYIRNSQLDKIVTGKNKHNTKEFSVMYELW